MTQLSSDDSKLGSCVGGFGENFPFAEHIHKFNSAPKRFPESIQPGFMSFEQIVSRGIGTGVDVGLDGKIASAVPVAGLLGIGLEVVKMHEWPTSLF